MMASSEDSTTAARRNFVSSACRFEVMSRAIFEAPIILPVRSLIGETVSETSINEPSLRRRTVS